jgi:hypothetical protein
MTTTVERAVVSAFRTARRLAGVDVSITRGATTISVVALPGDGLHEYSQDGVVTSEVRSRDFLILVSDYDFGDGATEPQRNDVIVHGSTTYKVLSDGGEIYFKYADPHHTVMRLHCKPA